jgi:hypothetical protein
MTGQTWPIRIIRNIVSLSETPSRQRYVFGGTHVYIAVELVSSADVHPFRCLRNGADQSNVHHHPTEGHYPADAGYLDWMFRHVSFCFNSLPTLFQDRQLSAVTVESFPDRIFQSPDQTDPRDTSESSTSPGLGRDSVW